jgi:hypothetical protein
MQELKSKRVVLALYWVSVRAVLMEQANPISHTCPITGSLLWFIIFQQ